MACYDFPKEARHRILIESDSEAADAYGGQTESWSEVATVWASVKPASDYQRFQSLNLQSKVTHIFVIRYRSGLADVKTTVKHRITLDSRKYDITAIKNMDDTLKLYGKAYQIIMADENGADV